MSKMNKRRYYYPLRNGFYLVVFIIQLVLWPLPSLAQMPFSAPAGPSEISLGKGVPTTGRFQVFVSPNIEGKTFMIDSDTGKIWVVKKDHSTGELYLQKLTVEDINEKKKDNPETDKNDSK